MGLGYTEEIVTKVAPARIFQAGAVDMHNLAPKILPDMVAGCKILEGDGGAGTIKQIDFTEGSQLAWFTFIVSMQARPLSRLYFCFVNCLLIKRASTQSSILVSGLLESDCKHIELESKSSGLSLIALARFRTNLYNLHSSFFRIGITFIRTLYNYDSNEVMLNILLVCSIPLGLRQGERGFA